MEVDDLYIKSNNVEGRSVSWEALPDDMWEAIFRKLDDWGSPDMESISLVCKRFLPISNRTRKSVYIKTESKANILLRPCFYSRFPFVNSIYIMHPDPNLGATIINLAHSSLPLQSLFLYKQALFPTEAMRHLGRCMAKTLRSLSCQYFDVMNDGDLVVVAECFSYLHKLEIRGSHCRILYDNVTDKEIWEISTKLKSLVSLDILGQRCVSHQLLKFLASNCSSLRELQMDFNGDHKSVFCMDQVDQVNFFRPLTSLELHSLQISDLLLLQLSELDWKLRELKLFSPKFTGDISGSRFCGFLKSCRSLSLLDLSNFPFPMHTDAVEFATSIPNIRSLHLDSDYGNVLPPKVLLYLLKNCILIDSISLFSCMSQRVAASQCVGGALDWKKAALGPCLISSLRMYFCNDLCDETLKIIVSICPKLHALSIVGCSKITEEEIKASTTTFNNIKFLYVDECDGSSIDEAED